MKRILHIIFLILTFAVSGITLLSAYGGMIDPARFYALPAMLSMTFPVWVIVITLLFIATLFINRRMAWVEAVTMVLCVGPFLDFCPLNFTHEAPDHDPGFTLLTYNVYYEDDYLARESDEANPTVEAILNADADVVCLQETRRLTIPYTSLHITEAQVDSLNARYPYQYYGKTALAVMSKYPLDNVTEPELPGETASLLMFTVNINGELVEFFNVHLQSIGLTPDDKELYMELTRGNTGNTDNNLKLAKDNIMTKLYHAFKNRSNQARLLKEIITASPAENVVVCGDFNDIAGCYAMRTLESTGLKNAYSRAGLGPSYTYRANRFYFHIDQVLYNNGMKPTDMRVLKNTGASDHLPVFTEFEFM